MSIQKIFSKIHTYNSMTILPFEGIKGFSLYLNNKEEVCKELLKKHLEICKNFCEVFLLTFDNPEEAIMKDVFIYNGVKLIWGSNNDSERKIYEEIKKVSDTIKNILESRPPDKEIVEECTKILYNLISESEKKLEKPSFSQKNFSRYIY